jgi:uncharacterized protein YdeI (YjbR/CyaY-like superfamily)
MTSPPRPAAEQPAMTFADKAAWTEWLDRNHDTSSGVWVRIARKDAGQSSVTYDEAVEAALCYGWIDGQSKRENEVFWLQRYTPRSKRSMWSKRNREKALALIERGEMRAAGLAEVERAQRDGRWDAAYDAASQITVPDDLQAALDATPAAQAFFATLDSRNRFAILHRIQTAKKPETRARRIQEFVQMLAENRKIYGP